MSKLIANFLIVFVLSLKAVFALDCQSAGVGKLDYQSRGDRCEGIKSKPVSKHDIELLSAMTYHGKEQQPKWKPPPNQCKLQFYLPEQKAVDLTVQELKPKHYYLLNQVIPQRPFWQQGINKYQWSTETVIKPLKLDISTLGVLVHLEKQGLDNIEKVAPVTFYHAELPEEIEGYLFDFKIGSNAELKYTIYKDNEKSPKAKDLGKRFVDNPFRIFWESAEAEQGEYKLIVHGYFLGNNKPIRYVVQFYHKGN